MSNPRPGHRTPGLSARLPSKPFSNKKKPIPVGKTGAIRPFKSSQGGGPLNSGTGNASSSAKAAVQSVAPKSAKSKQAGGRSHEPVLPDNSSQDPTGSSTSNAVSPGSSSLSSFLSIPYSSSPAASLLSLSFPSLDSSSSSHLSSDFLPKHFHHVYFLINEPCGLFFFALFLLNSPYSLSSAFEMSDQPPLAYKRYVVFSTQKIFAYLAWIALLPCRALMALSAFLACRVLLARKPLLIALVLGLFASVAVSIHCTNQYLQLNSQFEKYSHTNRNSSAQLNASALRLQDLEKQAQGLSNRIASINGIFPVKERPQINWLSPLVGATIIPELCSPPSPPNELKFEYSNLEKPEELKNQEAAESHKNGWYYRWLRIKAQLPTNSGLSAPGPATALLPWTEAERRYCVPEGQALQLALTSPRYILPTRLVIEHWRKGNVPGSLMRRAPKDIELWSYIEVEDDAAKVRDESLALYPGLNANYDQQNGSLHSKQYLKFPWIPIGLYRYQIDTARNVQDFRIEYDFKIPMKRFAIRVISNWGDLNETCLVRVRLYGEE